MCMGIIFVLGNAGFKDFAQKPLIGVKLMVLPNFKKSKSLSILFNRFIEIAPMSPKRYQSLSFCFFTRNKGKGHQKVNEPSQKLKRNKININLSKVQGKFIFFIFMSLHIYTVKSFSYCLKIRVLIYLLFTYNYIPDILMLVHT